MNLFGEPTLRAIGVIGSDREVVGPASFHSDDCPRVGDRYHAHIFAGTNTVIYVITRYIRFKISIPYERYVGDSRVWATVVRDAEVFSFRLG